MCLEHAEDGAEGDVVAHVRAVSRRDTGFQRQFVWEPGERKMARCAEGFGRDEGDVMRIRQRARDPACDGFCPGKYCLGFSHCNYHYGRIEGTIRTWLNVLGNKARSGWKFYRLFFCQKTPFRHASRCMSMC